jgi:hypothetical protein
MVRRGELNEYFRCLIFAIRNNELTRKIFFQLADKNIRNGIQLFTDICKSGYIDTESIFKVRTIEGFELSSNKVLNALIRKNRKYYSGEASNFINLFYSSYEDDFPDPFIRIDILRWLDSKKAIDGPSGIKGLYQISNVLREMQIIGHDTDIAFREIRYMVKKGLINSENLVGALEEEDCIKIWYPGILHLQMLSDIRYIAACAEDSLYRNTDIMMRISRRISRDDYLSKYNTLLTAKDFVNYLDGYKKGFTADPSICFNDSAFLSMYDLKECFNAIERFLYKDANAEIREAISLMERYSYGKRLYAQIVSKKNNGITCIVQYENEPCIKCFMSALDEWYQLSLYDYDRLKEGDMIDVEVMDYNIDYKSFQVRYISQYNLNK